MIAAGKGRLLLSRVLPSRFGWLFRRGYCRCSRRKLVDNVCVALRPQLTTCISYGIPLSLDVPAFTYADLKFVFRRGRSRPKAFARSDIATIPSSHLL